MLVKKLVLFAAIILSTAVIVWPQEEKPKQIVVKLSKEEGEQLARLQKELKEGETNYREAILVVQAYQSKQNAFQAFYYKAFADHAKDGVKIDTHDLNIPEGFSSKKP